MTKTFVEINGEKNTQKIVNRLVKESIQFDVDPWPNNYWRIEFKPEHRPVVARVVAELEMTNSAFLEKHIKVAYGQCRICGHYGKDCTGDEK